MQKKIAVVVVILLMIGSVAWLTLSRQPDGGSAPVVGLTQIATHPALDEVRLGIINGLEKRGFVDGESVRIVFRNANGDGSLTRTIADDFVRTGVDVIVPISTPSALAAAQATTSIPIVFAGVTDPVGTGLVDSLENPGKNITGVSDRWPFRAQVEAFRDVFPDRKVIGMLYTKGDDVSKIGVDAMRRLASELDFKLELAPVSSPQDVYPSAAALLQKVDAVYTGIDHLILENMSGLVKASNENGKPIFGGESGSVEKGAVLALSINMSEFGDLTADMIAKVLQGTSPAEMAVSIVSSGDLVVNADAAKRFGVDIDPLRAKGARIIE